MSVTKLRWCRQLSTTHGISHGAFRVGFVLVEHFDFQKPDVWSSQKKLADMMGVSERVVRDYIRELVSAGFLTKKRGGMGNPNRYVMTLPDRQDFAGHDRQDFAGQEIADRQISAAKSGGNLPLQTGGNLPPISLKPLEEPLKGREGPPGPSPQHLSQAATSVESSTEDNGQSRNRDPAPRGRSRRREVSEEEVRMTFDQLRKIELRDVEKTAENMDALARILTRETPEAVVREFRRQSQGDGDMPFGHDLETWLKREAAL